MEHVNKSFDVEIQKAASDEYDARFIMSASTPDRVKDTIDPEAYKSNLGKKLIALYQHDPDRPIGKWENLRVEAGKLIGDLKVASTNLGLMVKQLLADEIPLGASIGFRGKGEANKIGGIHFREIELFECSVVSIPAHPRAMQIAKSFGIDIQSSDVGANSVESDRQPEAVLDRAKAAILSANRNLRK
jgi:HK97 family phage prohead protease